MVKKKEKSKLLCSFLRLPFFSIPTFKNTENEVMARNKNSKHLLFVSSYKTTTCIYKITYIPSPVKRRISPALQAAFSFLPVVIQSISKMLLLDPFTRWSTHPVAERLMFSILLTPAESRFYIVERESVKNQCAA